MPQQIEGGVVILTPLAPQFRSEFNSEKLRKSDHICRVCRKNKSGLYLFPLRMFIVTIRIQPVKQRSHVADQNRRQMTFRTSNDWTKMSLINRNLDQTIRSYS